MNGKAKTQDDPNLRILRDLTHLPANKYCFDCGQRGPTYVNITIGSFICMSCSGLLRGLTPPHRVKSISMASFTPDEIELLKSKGNEYCKRVWLATCSAKDSNIGTEKDPDRVNLLRNFMSAKYEQKRFYVDPSKLPRGEISEIQAQNAKALNTISQSGSTNGMQKSPSLSSTRSFGSQHSNPSPLMSNGRHHNSDHHHLSLGGPNRLVSSMTLPDIKPLASLVGPSVPSITTNQNNLTISASTGHSNSIDFINNLSSSSNQSSLAALKPNLQIHNNFSPWVSTNHNAGGGDKAFESNQQNFADFEDAFRRSELNSPTTPDLFAGQMDGANAGFGGIAFPPPNHSAGNGMKSPILPFHGASTPNQPIVSSTPQIVLNSNSNTNEDKYAALKDLDSLFKQSANGDANGGNGFANTNAGLPSSVSVPANLSSSANSGTAGWFSTSPNQNPFSQAPAPAPVPIPQQPSNGWNGSHNGLNGVENGNGTGVTSSNPFVASSNAWKSPPLNSSPNTRFFATGASQGFNGGVGANNTTSQHGLFQSGNVSLQGKPFNPFFGNVANPHNPFL